MHSDLVSLKSLGTIPRMRLARPRLKILLAWARHQLLPQMFTSRNGSCKAQLESRTNGCLTAIHYHLHHEQVASSPTPKLSSSNRTHITSNFYPGVTNRQYDFCRSGGRRHTAWCIVHGAYVADSATVRDLRNRSRGFLG